MEEYLPLTEPLLKHRFSFASSAFCQQRWMRWLVQETHFPKKESISNFVLYTVDWNSGDMGIELDTSLMHELKWKCNNWTMFYHQLSLMQSFWQLALVRKCICESSAHLDQNLEDSQLMRTFASFCVLFYKGATFFLFFTIYLWLFPTKIENVPWKKTGNALCIFPEKSNERKKTLLLQFQKSSNPGKIASDVV